MNKQLHFLEINEGEEFKLSFLNNNIPAGFPSPVQEADSDYIDLNRELIHNPSSTFCARVIGESMIDCGINDGDLLIIDKAIPPQDGCVAVCFIDGDFTVKRLCINQNGIVLMPENTNYTPIHISEECNFQVWGVVTHIIKTIK